MKIIRGEVNLNQLPKTGCVATIGTFDGFHLGHRAMVQQLLLVAKAKGLPSAVIFFEPQPREYFQCDQSSRIMTLRDKFLALNTFGVDYVIIFRFCERFANQSAEDFVQTILHDKMNVKHVIIGGDFHFGCDRKGNAAYLASVAEDYGFEIQALPTVNHGEARVSSTRVREALIQGDFSLASALLGQPYKISGKVIQGAKKAAELGYPTANIQLKRKMVIPSGVYAVRVSSSEFQGWPAVANIGVRPTLDGLNYLLEVHLFDFSENLYQKPIQVELIHFMREEIKFNGFDALKAQIKQDVIEAQHYFYDEREIL